MPTDEKFTGQRLDGTGLYYYNARYYDPSIGRFISPDVYVQFTGSSQSLNRYSYVLNNPLRYIDPTGWWTWGISLSFSVSVGNWNVHGSVGFDVCPTSHQIGGYVSYGGSGTSLSSGAEAHVGGSFSTSTAESLGQGTSYSTSAGFSGGLLGDLGYDRTVGEDGTTGSSTTFGPGAGYEVHVSQDTTTYWGVTSYPTVSFGSASWSSDQLPLATNPVTTDPPMQPSSPQVVPSFGGNAPANNMSPNGLFYTGTQIPVSPAPESQDLGNGGYTIPDAGSYYLDMNWAGF